MRTYRLRVGRCAAGLSTPPGRAPPFVPLTPPPFDFNDGRNGAPVLNEDARAHADTEPRHLLRRLLIYF